VGAGGEMTQALYAHMNNKKKFHSPINKDECFLKSNIDKNK
jgi:hypothetical protein